MRYYATVEGESVLAERTPDGVQLDGREVAFQVEPVGTDRAHFVFDDRSADVVGVRTASGWRVMVRGREYVVELEGERARAIRELTGLEAVPENSDLLAPMPGLVVKVLVEAGQSVSAGDGLVVVEAMKMENELRATADGIVASVEVSPGVTVERDEVLIRFEEDAP